MYTTDAAKANDIRDLFGSRGSYNRRTKNITTLTHGLPTRDHKYRSEMSPQDPAAPSRRNSSMFSTMDAASLPQRNMLQAGK
jgi:hypothetical protein